MASADPSKRTASSCDHCRQHKVKCIRSENGTCRRCLKTGHRCVTSNVRTGRPYYQSSKEQYDLMSTVVRHFLPDATLSTEGLRDVVSHLQQDNMPRTIERRENSPVASQPDTFVNYSTSMTNMPPTCERPPTAAMESNVHLLSTAALLPNHGILVQDPLLSVRSNTRPDGIVPLSSSPLRGLNRSVHSTSPSNGPNISQTLSGGDIGYTNLISPPVSWTSETFPIESMPRRENTEITRYDSGTSWSSFFSKIRASIQPHYDSSLRNPQSMLEEISVSKQIDLVQPDGFPSQSDFERASRAFFAEINAVNYILSYDVFHTYIFDVYTEKRPLSHAVFMILCLILDLDGNHEGFFSKACQHFDKTLEEGSLESVQALMLIVLCRLNRDQRNLAWTTLGCASRIAQSLGLHLNESCWDEKTPLVIENRKRLWWSLYDLEICLAYRLGRSPGIDEASYSVGIPSETIYNLVPNVPPDYYTVVSQLTKITATIVRDLYGPRSAYICLDIRADDLLDNLGRFWEGLPSHLKPDAATAPAHSRAVLYLGLRYDYAILLATRPSIVSCFKYPGSCSAKVMERVDMAESASKRSLLLLRRMAQGGLLSRQNYLDVSYILANILMFVLRLVKDPSLQLLEESKTYCDILDLTQHLDIGRFTKRHFDEALREVRSTLDSQGKVADVQQRAIDELWQGFMGVDECLWPTWPVTEL